MQLFTTFADMGIVPPERSWTMLRSLRANPPGAATRGHRKRTFTAALEQAEQLFTAASTVGVATKPILAFYGLSQAGRALAAAGASQQHWRLSGHGIKSGETQDNPGTLADLTVVAQGGGAFTAIGDILGSSALRGRVRLGDLWPLIAEVGRHPLPGSGTLRSLTVHVDPSGWVDRNPTVRVGSIPRNLIGDAELSPAVSMYGSTYTAQADAIEALLRDYPTLAQRRQIRHQGRPLGLQDEGDALSVLFAWPGEVVHHYRTPDHFAEAIATMTRGEWRAYPTLDDTDRPVHLLLVWWAILFRLSMLARYEPQGWDSLTDVNTSPDAVPIEHLLETALTSIPQLLVQQITAAASTPSVSRTPRETVDEA